MQSLFDAADDFVDAEYHWRLRQVMAEHGRHLDAGYVAGRLRATVGARAARLGTLHELSKLAPTAMIAEILGYSPATIELHARDSAANYAAYIKARLDAART